MTNIYIKRMLKTKLTEGIKLMEQVVLDAYHRAQTKSFYAITTALESLVDQSYKDYVQLDQITTDQLIKVKL